MKLFLLVRGAVPSSTDTITDVIKNQHRLAQDSDTVVDDKLFHLPQFCKFFKLNGLAKVRIFCPQENRILKQTDQTPK